MAKSARKHAAVRLQAFNSSLSQSARRTLPIRSTMLDERQKDFFCNVISTFYETTEEKTGLLYLSRCQVGISFRNVCYHPSYMSRDRLLQLTADYY